MQVPVDTLLAKIGGLIIEADAFRNQIAQMEGIIKAQTDAATKLRSENAALQTQVTALETPADVPTESAAN